MAWTIMSGTGRVNNAEEEVAAARYPEIRLFAVSRVSSLEPKADATSNGWRVVTPETVASFSAVAYFFGRELHHRCNVPIGLIEAD
jgi:sialate O-acetylesterase